jgi:hypothetical protein
MKSPQNMKVENTKEFSNSIYISFFWTVLFKIWVKNGGETWTVLLIPTTRILYTWWLWFSERNMNSEDRAELQTGWTKKPRTSTSEMKTAVCVWGGTDRKTCPREVVLMMMLRVYPLPKRLAYNEKNWFTEANDLRKKILRKKCEVLSSRFGRFPSPDNVTKKIYAVDGGSVFLRKFGLQTQNHTMQQPVRIIL